MAQRGRKPKPVEAKAASGNPGRRSLATLVPPPRPGEMLCPHSVVANERARTYWTMYLANASAGHLAPIDAPLLARLCLALAYADEADEKIRTLGLLVKAPNTGLPLQSPYLPIVNRQTDIARKLAVELALPPAQRNRLGGFGPELLVDDAGWDLLDELARD